MVRRLLLVVAVGAAVLAGCGGSGYRYVSNREEGAFFKVPDDWAVYEEDDLLTQEPGMSDEEIEAQRAAVWLRGFDADRSSEPENVLALDAAEPRGYAEVRRLSASEADTVSFNSLRRSGFPTDQSGEPIDPLAYEQENPDGPVHVLQYDQLVLDGGSRGVRLVARIEGEATIVFDRATVVNAAADRRFTFTVGCRAECWDQHEDLIKEIADSWTLEQP